MEELLKELKITLRSLNLEHLARYVDDLYNSVEKTHIAFVGEYNAGKSSLINTLLGKKILAERDLPTTNRVVLVTHCPVEKREKLDEYTEQVCIKDERLKYLVLVDTPGLSSAIREHEDALLRYLHKADLIVIVAPSNQPYTKEIETLLNLLKDRHSTQWAYVINIFEDPSVYEEDPTKLQRLKEFVREKLRGILSAEDVEAMPIFAFSVRAVRKGLDYPLLTREYEDFERFIFEEVAERAKQLKFQSLKEKILKLLSGEEILNLHSELERLKTELSKWEEIKNRVEEFEKRVLSEKREKIETRLGEIFEDLKKDLDEIVERYTSLGVVKQGSHIAGEISDTLKGRLLSGEILSEVERLLDYRPELVRLKKLFPELLVEPTIPPKLQTMKNKLVEDIEKFPATAGEPGKLAKWLVPLGVLLAVIGVATALLKGDLLWVGVGIATLGGLIFLISLIRVLTAKNTFKGRLETNFLQLLEHYKKLYTSYFGEKFGEKLSKVYEYLDTRIESLKQKTESLEGKLKKLENVKRKLEEV